MICTENFSDLLVSLYAAPLQAEKWQVFYDQLSSLTKTSCGYLITGGASGGQEILAGGGCCFNPEVQRLYSEGFGQLDPFWAPFFRDPRVAVIQGDELVTHEQLVNTEFYCGLLSKHQMESMTLLSCTSTAEQTDIMTVWRRAQDGRMDNDSVALLTALLPHAHTALTVRGRLLKAGTQSHFAELALDSLVAAAFLVSSAGNVLHMNKLAVALVNKASGLRMRGASLAAWNPTESARLKSLIAGAASRDRNRTNCTPGGALQISQRGSLHPLHVAVLPVPENLCSMMRIPHALVFVSDPAASPRSRAHILVMLFALTPAEARLADLLLQGMSVSEAGNQMSITLETTRFQLKRVLAKTGTHRQTELMRLMLSLPGAQ